MRRSSHFSLLRKNKHYIASMQDDFNSFGEKKFSFEVIKYIDNNAERLKEEKNFIRKMRPFYNTIKRSIGTNSLARYIEQNNIDRQGFADTIGCSAQSIWLWATGGSIPLRKFMTKIMEVTGGQVTANDFYYIPKKRKNA